MRGKSKTCLNPGGEVSHGETLFPYRFTDSHLNCWRILGEYRAGLGLIQPSGATYPRAPRSAGSVLWLFLSPKVKPRRFRPPGGGRRAARRVSRLCCVPGAGSASPRSPVIPPLQEGAGVTLAPLIPPGKVRSEPSLAGTDGKSHHRPRAQGWGRMRPLDHAWCWVVMLLLALFSDVAGGRRGAGGRSGGAGGRSGGAGGQPGGLHRVARRPAGPEDFVRAGPPPPAGGFQAGGWPDMGAKRGPPSRAPGDRRAGPGLALLLASGSCLVSHGLQR
ncbi:translation initiation factor IF-2-like [Corvus kubaryi]|uniref:translation initiation factor IF-2-like n=1 Tax=Corvus kubaryi TaxID=68294 RepID=UPI001C0417C9|nr:translation initiation factor IF-2-like [Corvus kubaryi]